MPPALPSLRQQALLIVEQPDPSSKVAQALALDRCGGRVDADTPIVPPQGLPGRPARPRLVPQRELVQRPVGTLPGRAALLHSIAHIELNAIDLAADIAWRFAGLPDDFYRDWLGVAQEEALHFTLLREHLRSLGFDYGDFPAHDALWQMAERTQHDLLARLGLVPRLLEARGLDASPAVKARLVGAGDRRAGEIIDRILHDEIGHVAIGNRWYRWLCAQRGLDPLATFAELARQHRAPRLRGPFNREARRAAGFTDDELDALDALDRAA